MENYLAIVFIYFLAAITPGANALLIMNFTLSSGYRQGLMAALGVSLASTSLAIVTIYAIKSLSLLDEHGKIYAGLTLFSAFFLAYVGVQTFKQASATRVEEPGGEINKGAYRKGSLSPFLCGFVTDIINPKSFPFYTAILGGTLAKAGEVSFVFYVSIVLSILLIALMWHSLLATFFSLPKPARLYDCYKGTIDRIVACFFFIFSIFLFIRFVTTGN